MHGTPPPVENRHLHRSLGLLQATAMNMSNMIGVGPFLTIPLILGRDGRTAGHAGMDPRRPAGSVRRHGLGRVGFGRAILRRHL